MGERDCIIGLDIGTTSVKATAYVLDGSELVGHSRRTQTEYGEDGSAVQDPEAVYQCVVAVLFATLRDVNASGRSVDAIGFSAAMHSLIPFDEEGTPLFPAMTWLDVRPHGEATALWESEIGKEIYHRTGTPVHAMAPIAKIAWFRKTHANLFHRTRRFASIKEYVWYRWFGVWEVDHAIAGATGLLEDATLEWSSVALAYLGASADQFSTLVPTTHVRTLNMSSITPDQAMGIAIPVCMGGSDGVLATLAANAMSGSRMILTMGTSLAIRTGTSTPVTKESMRNFSYPLRANQFVIGAPSNSGGVVLDWLYRNVLTENGADFEQRFPKLCLEAGQMESDDLFCLPYLSGERAPIWDESASASFIGLKHHHQQGHLMRAAIEGVLFNAYWIAEQLMDAVGKPDVLVVSGKLFQQGWVRAWTANLFNVHLETQADVDGATLGAAMIACEAIRGTTMKIGQPESTAGSIPAPGEHNRLYRKYLRFKQLCSAVLLTHK